MIFPLKSALILVTAQTLFAPIATARAAPASRDVQPRKEGAQLMSPEGPVYTDISGATELQNDLGIKHSLAALALHPPPNWVDDHILDLTNGKGVKGVQTTNASFLLHNVSDSHEEGGRKAFIYDLEEVRARFTRGINTNIPNWWWQGLELAIYDSVSPYQKVDDDRASPMNVLNLLTGLLPERLDVKDMSNDEYLKILKENKLVILETEEEQGGRKFNRVIIDIKSDTEISTTEIAQEWAEPRTTTPEELKGDYESLIVLNY